MSLAVAKPLHEKLEKEWDGDLFNRKGLATMFGWESQWTFRSQGSKAGFPDRTCWRDRVLWAELKREPPIGKKGQPLKLLHPLTDTQIATLDGLARASGEAYVWIPSDYDEIGKILGGRWRLYVGPPRGLVRTDGSGFWTPGSMWLPGFGRADGKDV